MGSTGRAPLLNEMAVSATTSWASKTDSPPRVRPSSAVSLFSPRRTTYLILILLLVVAGAVGYGIMRIQAKDQWMHELIAWSTCGTLVSLAIAVLLLGRHMMQRSLSHVEQQLSLLSREDRIDALDTPVPDELKPVMTALTQYVDRVRARVDRLRLQKKELDIQMRIADAERRHTEAIIFSISDAVLVIDSYGELVLANNAAENLFNFRLNEWRHRPVERILQDGAVVKLIKEARAAVDSNVRRVEYSTIRGDTTQTFNITLSTVVDAEGTSRGVVAIFHDITREREISQIKTDFVSAVSHELRTPLSGIRAYVEMLLDNEARDEQTRRDFYKIIDCETDRLQRLIDKVLDISRIEAGVMDIHKAVIEPNDVVKEVLDISAPQAREQEIALECELGENLPGIHADRDLLYQAVQNVVANGIKYARSGGRVSVRTGVDEETKHFTVSVADNGMGIRAEDLPRIFDKFFRTKEGTAAARGTGLGLNLVKHIVETVHQGEITVASEHGVGTTFVLRFPLIRQQENSPRRHGGTEKSDEKNHTCRG